MSHSETSPPVSAVPLAQQGLPRVFYALAVFILAGFILYVGRSILIPIVFALFLSFLMVTLKNTISAIPWIGKLLPDWLSFVLSFGVVAFVLFTLAEIIRANADDLVAAMPAYQARLAEIMSALVAQIKGISFLPDDLMSGFDQLREQALGLVRGFATELGNTIRSFASNLVTILLYTVFMLIERGKFLKKLALIAGPDHDRLDVDHILNDIGNLVRQYISIKTFTAFIVATISWLIMTVLGIDFAGLLGTPDFCPELYSDHRRRSRGDAAFHTCAGATGWGRDHPVPIDPRPADRDGAVYQFPDRAAADGALSQSQPVHHPPVPVDLGVRLGICRDAALCADHRRGDDHSFSIRGYAPRGDHALG